MTDRAWIGAQIAIVVVVLGAAIYGFVIGAPPGPAASAGATATPAESVVVPPPPSAAASGAATQVPLSIAPASRPPSATPNATATRKPLAFTSYTCNGQACTGVTLGTGWTILAPFDGHAEVHLYQLINGSIREGTDVSGVPVYPYVDVTANDGRRIRYRPGANETDTKVIVATNADVKAGDPLFTVVGTGPSSWHDFYDSTITFQIVVSLTSASGADLDAAPLIKAK